MPRDRFKSIRDHRQLRESDHFERKQNWYKIHKSKDWMKEKEERAARKWLLEVKNREPIEKKIEQIKERGDNPMSDFQESEVRVLNEYRDKDGILKSKIRVVVYGGKYIGVEKRSYFLGDDGKIRMGKAKMFNKYDWQTLMENKKVVEESFDTFNAQKPTDSDGLPF